MLIAKVVVEFFAGAMADAAFLTYLSLLCAREFSASQYAMLSSLAAVSLHGAGGFAGYAVEALGYPAFYAATILACLPSLLIALMLRDVAKKPQQANLA
jgi:PAT family beta-lactamase induction signal transducer AmpG